MTDAVLLVVELGLLVAAAGVVLAWWGYCAR
jgi:hypothetical protein